MARRRRPARRASRWRIRRQACHARGNRRNGGLCDDEARGAPKQHFVLAVGYPGEKGRFRTRRGLGQRKREARARASSSSTSTRHARTCHSPNPRDHGGPHVCDERGRARAAVRRGRGQERVAPSASATGRARRASRLRGRQRGREDEPELPLGDRDEMRAVFDDVASPECARDERGVRVRPQVFEDRVEERAQPARLRSPRRRRRPPPSSRPNLRPRRRRGVQRHPQRLLREGERRTRPGVRRRRALVRLVSHDAEAVRANALGAVQSVCVSERRDAPKSENSAASSPSSRRSNEASRAAATRERER